jgi:uncharacterized protein (TIGR02996 family)
VPRSASELEAAILADPDNADAYLVYADWLQAHGDPRGELIVLQHRGETGAADALLEEHLEHFWGEVADDQSMFERYPYSPIGPATAWRWGFLHSLWIGRTSPDGASVESVLAPLLDHPSARFLRELTVGIVSYSKNTYAGVAELIGARSLPALRRLILGDFFYEQTELNWSHAGELAPLWHAVPNLESLTVRSGTMQLGALDRLPKLRELVIITGGFDAESMASICSASWPVLERLNVQLGRAHVFTPAELAPILDGKHFPALRHLGLGNSRELDTICAALANSKLAAQLETIDLSKGTMGDAGAAALASGAFPKLVSIDVSENYLTPVGLGDLKRLVKTVISEGRRDAQRDDGGDPDDRYIAAYE